jgi:hypothetical protein
MCRSRSARRRLGDLGWAAAGSLVLTGWAVPTLAQEAQDAAAARPPAAPATEPDFDETEVEELVVTAGRVVPRGSVLGDIPPEMVLSPREIRSAGVSSVSELLDYLAPETASARGRGGERPIVLINGARISSFAEVRDIPTEAIVRAEVLPEEVSLKYGYRADQRVVNLVLPRRFAATTAEAGANAPTAGGTSGQNATVTHLRIQRDTRTQLSLKASRATALLESERDLVSKPQEAVVVGAPAGFTEQPYRTLSPQTASASINGVVTRSFAGGVSATLNASLEASDSRARLGPPGNEIVVPATNPFSPYDADVKVLRYDGGLRAVRRNTDSQTGHLGLAVNGARSGWNWSVTANADRVASRSVTDAALSAAALQAAVSAGDPTVDPFGAVPADYLRYGAPDRSTSVLTTTDADLVVNGTLFDAPAGALAATFKAGGETYDIVGESRRRGVVRATDLSRQVGQAQASFDLPIASKRRGVLEPLGELSLNANFAVDQLSDFGTLTTYGFGANWAPVKPLRLIASFTQEDGAPTIRQLGDPETVTPGVRVFDFRRGETVAVTRIDGGDPFLAADNRRVAKLGLTFKPFEATRLTFRADYVRTRIRDAIAAFPIASAEIEAAFPERFVRDADGQLLQIDVRPVNFEREDREQLRWGFTFSKPIGPVRPAGRRMNREGGRGGHGGGFGRGGRGGFGGGSLNLSVFHTWTFQDDILIRPGVAKLDLLDGSASGSSGGTPRHQVEMRAGASKNGLGVRLEGEWRSATQVRGGASGGQELRFSDLATVGLRVFADLGRQPFARGKPWLRGVRASLSVDNIFDEKQRVRAADGTTPITYQPDYLDPQGRIVRLSLRKVFF